MISAVIRVILIVSNNLSIIYLLQESFEFFNPHSSSTIHKRVRSVSECLPHESRRLWMNVTYNLKVGSVDKATEHKSFLEQRQRDEAKSRSERGSEWRQRVS